MNGDMDAPDPESIEIISRMRNFLDINRGIIAEMLTGVDLLLPNIPGFNGLGSNGFPDFGTVRESLADKVKSALIRKINAANRDRLEQFEMLRTQGKSTPPEMQKALEITPQETEKVAETMTQMFMAYIDGSSRAWDILEQVAERNVPPPQQQHGPIMFSQGVMPGGE